jgi:hypothetical protein
MTRTLSLFLLSIVTLSAADLPQIPAESIAVKKELLFQDDFEGAERSKLWHRVVDTFTFDAGTLKGTQTREKDTFAKDGKTVIKAHAAVYGPRAAHPGQRGRSADSLRRSHDD